MKLHFAFGNPRKKAKKSKTATKSRKKVAKKTKSLKTKKASKMRSVTKGSVVAKKKVLRKNAKKNPQYYIARKGGKIVGRGKKVATASEAGKLRADYYKALREYNGYRGTDAKKAKLRKTLAAAKGKLGKAASDAEAEMKTAKRYIEDGAEVKFYSTDGGTKMAKKKKAKKKVVGKKKKSTVKKVKASKKHKSAKKVSRKAKKAVKKLQAVASVAKVTRRKRRKSKKRAKMFTHRHSTLTRHLKKGTKLRVKAYGKSGKKRVSMVGTLKVNPRRNPMNNIDKTLESYAGMNTTQLLSIAVGGALVPTINTFATKIPGVDTVVAKLNEYLGPQAAGSIIPVALGVGASALGEHVLKGSQAKKFAKSAGQGLVAAGVIGLSMSLASKLLASTGLSGVNYTPMSGVNYTPMSGINYSPMGIVPQLAGPDFGRMGSTDYGGSGGYTEQNRFSKADFGGMSMDASGDEMLTEDDIADDSMLGGGLG